MAFLAAGLFGAVLILALFAYLGQRKPAEVSPIPDLEQQHQEEHQHDAAESKTADPVDYLRTGLERLR